MIAYNRNPQQTIASSAVKIIGLGGAGTNMLERISFDGLEGAELLAVNTDARTLSGCLAKDKIQLGVNLTRGLGSGGDPELGRQATLEAEEQIRESLQGSKIVFLCTGLGGGTGSGAAPIITRIAREEGCFVVVFTTMPFAFEGKRRRDQAEASLNELAVLSNALVTFDNNRMGELVVAKQGVHEAFAAADHMICESIKAVIRLVVRPGLINVGLDDLMSALRTNRSRCLFGSGIAEGADRATRALKNALSSPLLDQGALLKDAQTVLVHLSGGENLTLFEIELLMQSLQKFVPEKAHVLFGAAVDPTMGDSLSITLISALPEDSLSAAPRDSLSERTQQISAFEPSQGFSPQPSESIPSMIPLLGKKVVEPEPIAAPQVEDQISTDLTEESLPFAEQEEEQEQQIASEQTLAPKPTPVSLSAEFFTIAPAEETPTDEEESASSNDLELEPERPSFLPEPKNKPLLTTPWGKSEDPEETLEELPPLDLNTGVREVPKAATPSPLPDVEPPKLKLGVKPSGAENELSLDSAPRGRFEGETPNVFEGEDLDLPPFLRKKK
jgi:cell division protein FtsZ